MSLATIFMTVTAGGAFGASAVFLLPQPPSISAARQAVPRAAFHAAFLRGFRARRFMGHPPWKRISERDPRCMNIFFPAELINLEILNNYV